MDTIMQQLVDCATETKFSDLPEIVVHEIKRVLLDSVGCAVGAPRMAHGRIARDHAKKIGGNPESTILGVCGKVSSINAAFANGELINTLNYDCVYGIHIPPFVIPAPLALAETVLASGRDLILATALGLEIARRIQLAVEPPYWPKPSGPERGKINFESVSGHGPGVFGSAVGAGKMLGLSPEKMANAIGIAGYAGPPSTFRKWTDTVPARMTQSGPAGFTAEVGIRSALLADMGFYADTNIFEGEFNYWRFSGFQQWNAERVAAGLGTKWRCGEISYKRYPAGH
jgi:2-methylcitrate dehydratase PrpD